MRDRCVMPTPRNAYDHRLRELVCRTRDLDLAERLGVPRPTARSWLRRGVQDVVSADVFDDDARQLRVRVLRLERRVETLLGIVRLLSVLVRLTGLRLDSTRVPDGEQKQLLLDGIARATRVVPRSVALRVVGLKPSRYRLVFITGGAFTPKTQEFLAAVDPPTLNKPFDAARLLANMATLIQKARRNRGAS
jgi:hypothetical protein